MHPDFSPATLDYSTDIMTSVTQTTITAVPDDAAAVVVGSIIGVSAEEFRAMSEEEQDAAMDEGTFLQQYDYENHTISITWPSGKQNKCVVLAAMIPPSGEDAPVFGDFYAIDINWIR